MELVAVQDPGLCLGYQKLRHLQPEGVGICQIGRYRGLTHVGRMQIHVDHIILDLKVLYLLLTEQTQNFRIGNIVCSAAEGAGCPGHDQDHHLDIDDHR